MIRASILLFALFIASDVLATDFATVSVDEKIQLLPSEYINQAEAMLRIFRDKKELRVLSKELIQARREFPRGERNSVESNTKVQEIFANHLDVAEQTTEHSRIVVYAGNRSSGRIHFLVIGAAFNSGDHQGTALGEVIVGPGLYFGGGMQVVGCVGAGSKLESLYSELIPPDTYGVSAGAAALLGPGAGFFVGPLWACLYLELNIGLGAYAGVGYYNAGENPIEVQGGTGDGTIIFPNKDK